VQHGIEEVAGTVAGKDPAGAVTSVGSRSEAERQDTGSRVAVPGYRPRPVDLVSISRALLLADALAILPKSRTAFTCGDSFM
jgi:hypothetical protein